MSVSSHGPSFCFCLMFLFVSMTLAVWGKSFLQCREMDFIVDVRGVRIHRRTMDRHLSHLGLCICILVGASQSFRLFCFNIWNAHDSALCTHCSVSSRPSCGGRADSVVAVVTRQFHGESSLVVPTYQINVVWHRLQQEGLRFLIGSN
jgi:hypothetical protein